MAGAGELADRSPEAALSTLDRLEARAKSLGTLADRGRIVPEFGRLHVQQYRELGVSPDRLIYGSAPPGSWSCVVDARRSLEDALLDRLVRVEGQEQ